MRIIAADDERLALEILTEAIHEAMGDVEVASFLKAREILPYVEEHGCDIAFLDIRMRGVSGIEIALKIKAAAPKANIIFVTGFGEYASDAMKLHASGYIEKPVTAEKIKKEVEDLRYPMEERTSFLLKIVCFGNFDVYTADGMPVHFERSKAKECLAYLVCHCGTSSSIREIASVLFEDEPYSRKQANYMQKIISSMLRSLREAHAEEIIQKDFNTIAIDCKRIDCDYYRFRDGDAAARNLYQGSFMAQYPWAEYVKGYLENQVIE